jgi:hypothetical protein
VSATHLRGLQTPLVSRELRENPPGYDPGSEPLLERKWARTHLGRHAAHFKGNRVSIARGVKPPYHCR